ncbi:MAG: glutamate decarboxylase [Firmicutes bacterium]|nr:glutamate decarboxylase [Bacillota bacterium]
MWTVVYIAPNKALAEMLKEVLVKEGLLCMLRSMGVPQMGAAGSVEVLVPEGEVEEAHEILTGVLGV